MTSNIENPSLTIYPIGIIRTSMISKFDAPHQPDQKGTDQSTIELFSQQNYEAALKDLDGFDYVWVLFWFNRNKSWRPKVRPPRGGTVKRGVFATRSPHRPNPIGMSALKLIRISGRTIIVGSCDLVDGTPILDIKPYVPAVDSFPSAKIGWLQNVEDALTEISRFEVVLSSKASEQVAILKSKNISFIERAKDILSRDPSPSKSRRIRSYDEKLFCMGCADWRLFFSIDRNVVNIEFIQPGRRIKDQGLL